MSLKDILAIDTNPVGEKIIYDIGAAQDSPYAPVYLSIEKWTRFLLFYRYIEKFVAALGISVSLPAVNYCLSKKDRKVEVDKYVTQWQSGEFAKRLFIQVMTKCNWKYSIMTYKGEVLTELSVTQTSELEEWRSIVKLTEKMKKTLQSDYCNGKYYIFWNYYLGWYLQFRERNPRKVELAFMEGDKKIDELLKKICNPLCIRFEEDFCMLDGNKYLLGLFEGMNSSHEVNFRMMDYLFLVRIIVLDKLLEHAGKIFEKEEKM